jgi:5-methylcytosine-specific restriction endonuclease McrA
MNPQVGQVYARRRNGKAEVVRVIAVDDEWAEFHFLHGPMRSMRAGTGRCKAKNFTATGWALTDERDDYTHLDGATRFSTYVVLDTKGEPILRCSAKRAAFYLRKGFAREQSPGVLQFIDPQTEERLKVLYLGGFTEFFMEVKNDRCCVCGATCDLTRHHVVPKRHKRKLPQPWRSCLSNVLFVCGACHRKYEEAPEPEVPLASDWQAYARAWKAHFFAVLEPRFVPAGWDIISVRNFDAVANGEA